MQTLDQQLLALRAAPADPRLDGLEGAVLAGLGEEQRRRAANRRLALTASIALVAGIAGSLVPGGDGARARTGGDGLTMAPALAPSQILSR